MIKGMTRDERFAPLIALMNRLDDKDEELKRKDQRIAELEVQLAKAKQANDDLHRRYDARLQYTLKQEPQTQRADYRGITIRYADTIPENHRYIYGFKR